MSPIYLTKLRYQFNVSAIHIETYIIEDIGGACVWNGIAKLLFGILDEA